MARVLAWMAIGAILTMWARGLRSVRPVSGRTTDPAGPRRRTRSDTSEKHSDHSA